MKQRTWPERSEGCRFAALPSTSMRSRNPKKDDDELHSRTQLHHSKQRTELLTRIPNSSYRQIRFCYRQSSSTSSSTTSDGGDFSSLPYDVLIKIAATFTLPNLRSASLVCKSWSEALRPLKEAMLLLRWGKRFKHGRGGVRPNLDKALDSFLKGAARGSTLAMVDAGLMYWEMGKKEEATRFYREAAVLGDPAGQCNLGISYLQAESPNPTEAVKWLRQAALSDYVRAQYQLAICLHQGRGVDRNIQEAARWYLKAARGGYMRAMYNVSLCYSFGEGLTQDLEQARRWMKRAADHGHSKAQFEHGLRLFAERDMIKAVVYLELAGRAGERAAEPVKAVIVQQLSPRSHDRVRLLADNWCALPSSR